jgi:hypothetical protein
VTAVPRLLLSVLVLPDSLDGYLRGKRRQAVRTNLNNAKRAGIAVAELPDSSDSLAAYFESVGSGSDTAGRTGDAARSLLENPGALAMSATDAEGRLLCMGAAIIDGTDAYLVKLISIRDRAGASEARYVVHTALTAALIHRGARRLWADGPLAVPPGVQKFQRLLGYESARARISRLSAIRATDEIVPSRTPAEVPPT